MLTDAQKHQFDTLGFLCLKDFLSPDEMQAYTDAFDETLVKATGVDVQQAHEERKVIGSLRFFESNSTVYHRAIAFNFLPAAN